MGTTYKKTNNAVATYGENSASVKALQKSLNKKGANLKVDSMYGPQTKLAFEKYGGSSSDPAPTTTNTGNEDISRYIRTANPKDKGIENSERKLREYSAKEPNYDDILEQKRRASQGIIDAITAQYNRTLEAQGIENRGMNDRVRAMNVSAGLGGSDFGTANAVGQEKKNQKANDLIMAERDAKINEILTGIDSRADEAYKAQRAEYVQSMKDDIEAQKNAREEDRNRAKESIAGLASAGISIDKLKSVDEKSYNTLLEEYGGSQLDLESTWNASLPDNLKVQYGQITKKGANGNAVILRYGLNPVTGKTEQKEYDMGIKYGDFVAKGEPELKEIDGRLWSVERDENGNQVAKPLTDVSELTRSMINENNASAEKSRREGDGSVNLTPEKKSKLLGAGLSKDNISFLEKDINQYGLESVLNSGNSGLNDQQKKAIRESYGSPEKVSRTQLESTVTQKMALEGLKESYTEKELKGLADENGYSALLRGKDFDINKFLNSPEAKKAYVDLLYNQYKSAGMAQ
jgi:hypothetical protein